LAIVVVSGQQVEGVEYGTAHGAAQPYIVGCTPVVEMLRVDNDRNKSRLVGVKYSHHRLSDPLKGPRGVEMEQIRVTMLVSGGPWQQRCWRECQSDGITLQLQEPGDFIAWGPGVNHEWKPLGDATMITVGFVRDPKTVE
jgi:hypothetical protein